MSLLRFGQALGQTLRGLPENPLVSGGLGLMSANAPGQRTPVDQPGSFLKGMLSANALRQNRLLQEEQAKERERQEAQRIATNQFFQNVANRPQMVADRNLALQMQQQQELAQMQTPFNAADMRATLPADMQARSIGDAGPQTAIHTASPIDVPPPVPTISEMAFASGVPGIRNKAFESMMKTPDLTTAQKNASALGLIPNTPEYIEFIRKSAGGSGGSTADISNYEFFTNLSPKEQEMFMSIKRETPELAGLKQAAKTQAAAGGVYLTPAEKKIDELFATTAAEYLTKDKAQIQGNVKNLARKIKILESGELNVSGPAVGLLPRKAQSIFASDALAFIGDIEDIVFQSLKEKLGGQFSDSEGKRLVAAAFDQSLSEEQNIKRLERLLQVIIDAAESKEEMIAYLNDNGTLKGYVQQPLDFEFLFDSLIQDDFIDKTDAELEQIALEGDQATKGAIIRFLRKREK
jgi:hypothetical protein